MKPLAVWWLRRDLRLEDNSSLHAALTAGFRVIPLFILDPVLFQKEAAARKAFLFAGLDSLDQSLRQHNSRLILREGEPAEELARLVMESGATAIFAEEDFSPYARQRDLKVSRELPLHLISGLTAHPPPSVCKPDGSAYVSYTPFSHRWKALPLPSAGAYPAPAQFEDVPNFASLPLPPSNPPTGFSASETEASRRLTGFLSGPIFSYEAERNRMDLPGTSTLSPYLRFGVISPRRVVNSALEAIQNAPTPEARQSCESWLNELIWREFYISILFHFPRVKHSSFRPSMRDIPWRLAPAELLAWQNGQTGYPIVDAGMRQLAQTGWMHNRARMITASFLVKDLLIHWQEGESWFMRCLVDGDPAANNGGWQWTAGTGTDAAPYFRIFNPVTQGKKFDPLGNYVRRWVPELSQVPLEWIHSPWEMDSSAQKTFHCQIGREYPAPIVDHATARERTLQAYQKKDSSSGLFTIEYPPAPQ
jgi:deoxyribodipyrimidine photo-lyase